MQRHFRSLISLLLCVSLLCGSMPMLIGAAEDGMQANAYYSDNYKATKITNPTTGSGEADGLLLGEEANRLNSYAWATAYRDGYLYIGVNRNFLQVAINSFGTGLGIDALNQITTLVSHGELPEFSEEQRQPQIIKLNPQTGETEVIYEPPYVEEWGYYRDAAYRHVIEYHGDLYFGTFSGSSARILKVDENDAVTEVFSGGGNSSYRSGCIYQDALYYAGLDARIPDAVDENGTAYTKMAIIRMVGDTWERVADYKDFIDYAADTIYQGEGGNMWDIIEYNGYLYAIIATSDGFVMFRGIEDAESADANEYGWVWEEVIGKNSAYHMGLAPTAEGYPTGGAVASSATPVVYGGKLYLGTFDYATRSMAAFVRQLVPYINGTVDSVKLSQLLAPLYTSVTHPQKLYEMDEAGNIREVTAFNELLEGTANEYIWRFQEHDGKLYIGTFDAETMYKYLTQLTDGFLATMDSDDLTAILGVLAGLLLNEEADTAEAQDSAADSLLSKVLSVVDARGVEMYQEIAALLAANPAGFDLYVTEDMEHFEKITDNGFDDPYNYGARTFVSIEDGLYIGTANPFYGAQVWLLTEQEAGEVVGKDIAYSLNLTDKTVSPALAGTMAGTLTRLVENDDVFDTLVLDAQGNTKKNTDMLHTGDTLQCSVRITFTEFKILEYTVVVLGDATGDGAVRSDDARQALRLAVGLDSAGAAVCRAADADQSGEVNSADARLILRAATGLDSLEGILA